jgi:hypothetical protein
MIKKEKIQTIVSVVLMISVPRSTTSVATKATIVSTSFGHVIFDFLARISQIFTILRLGFLFSSGFFFSSLTLNHLECQNL